MGFVTAEIGGYIVCKIARLLSGRSICLDGIALTETFFGGFGEHVAGFVGGHGDDGRGLAGNGVGAVAAFEGKQLPVVLELGVEEARELLDGVRPLLVDLVAGMAAEAAVDAQAEGLVALAEGLVLIFEGRDRVHAAGAADEELALVLGIEVDEGLAAEEAFLERFGALHEYYLPDNGEPVLNRGFQNWNLLVLNMAAWLEGKEVVEEW